MLTPVVPEAPPRAVAFNAPPLPRSPSKRMSLRVETGIVEAAPAALSPRQIGARKMSKRFSQSRSSVSTSSDYGGGGHRQSLKFFRRMSTRKSLNASKKEIPPHLAKLLQKTAESKARVDAVKQILSEEPSFRNEANLDLLYDWMLENCKQYSNNIFGSAPEYIRREICRQMRLLKSTSNQMLIRQGDTGDRCYIVIDGLVDVYIKKKETIPAVSESPETPTAGGALNLAKEYGDMVANLGPGAMFGEIVLLNPSARRNATILSSQYTDTCALICLERADYIRLVRGASMEASHYNQAEILDQMYLFQGWEKNDKMKLVSAMRSLHFSSNDYLYRAGVDAKWMYIITAGEVVERVNWTVGKSTAPSNNLLSASSGSTASTSTTTPSASASLLPTNSQPSSSSTVATYSGGQREGPEKKVNIDLLLVGMGDVVGELPFVRNKLSVLFDIKAVTDVSALALDRRTFELMILHANPATHKACHATLLKLQRLTDEREDWRQQRLSCGTTYPNAHISITWQLMRMSALRCPRCGQRGHLPTDTRRCAMPPSPKRASLAGIKKSVSGSPDKHSSSAHLPPLAHHKKMTLISSSNGQLIKRDSITRNLMDDSYLPTAREQLEQCRLAADRRRVGTTMDYMTDDSRR